MSSRAVLVVVLFLVAACSAILGIDDTRVEEGSKLVCSEARADCDGLVENGCEADLSSAETCGSCTKGCDGGEPLCSGSAGSYACSAQCDAPSQICGSSCVDVSMSPTNCGRCGHDCGGGQCTGGVCQPVAVADAADQLVSPSALAVNDNAIFWMEPTRIRACPLPLGCAVAPSLIADAYERLSALAVTADKLYFGGCRACDDREYFYECPLSGCPAVSPPFVTSGYLQYTNITIGKTHVYWRSDPVHSCSLASCGTTNASWGRLGFSDIAALITDGDTLFVKGAAGTELKTCPEPTGCAAPATLTGSSEVTASARAYVGRFYWLSPGPSTGQVRSCAITACNGGEIFAVDNYGGTELAVDETGVYWINPTRGTLRHCPLAGCPVAGANTLASNLVDPKQLTLGKGFVYWIQGNTILKVAKP